MWTGSGPDREPSACPSRLLKTEDFEILEDAWRILESSSGRTGPRTLPAAERVAALEAVEKDTVQTALGDERAPAEIVFGADLSPFSSCRGVQAALLFLKRSYHSDSLTQICHWSTAFFGLDARGVEPRLDAARVAEVPYRARHGLAVHVMELALGVLLDPVICGDGAESSVTSAISDLPGVI